MRRKLRIALLVLLLAISLGALVHGVRLGDAALVQDNAAAFCFT